jgi:hypothetical protein
VTDLCVDSNEEKLLSSSDDGKAIITSVFEDNFVVHSYSRALKTVAFDPNYSKNGQFIIGGMSGQLILKEKAWIGSKDFVIHSGDFPIYACKWNSHNLIAFSTEEECIIYDVVLKNRLYSLKKDDNSLRADLYKCHLVWKSHDMLIIGWANVVTVVKIHKERSKFDLSSFSTAVGHSNSSNGCIEILESLNVDFYICGILPFNELLMLLAFNEKIDAETGIDDYKEEMLNATQPELHLLDLNGRSISIDSLPILGYEVII